jgi:DNA-binding CsgD family transcriptional regulator
MLTAMPLQSHPALPRPFLQQDQPQATTPAPTRVSAPSFGFDFPVPLLRSLLAAFDELDYGVAVLRHDAHALHVNHAARLELGGEGPLLIVEGALRARSPADAATLRQAIHDASWRGRRRLLDLGSGSHRAVVSVVPLGAAGPEPATVLLVFGKSAVCESLSIEAYARLHALTAAETKVLAALCGGDTPAKIAGRFGVALSTVRTQIGNLRSKTGARCIRDVLRQIAVLPPLRGALRCEA